MADVNANANVTTNGEGTTPEVNTQGNKPSVDDLMAEIAQLKADKIKSKNDLDAALKKAGDATKALRARQTAEEREAEEKAEAQRLADEERETLKKELNFLKATKAYKDIQDENTVGMLIEAVTDADHATIASILSNEINKAIKAKEAEWLLTRPQANVGNGNEYSSMTREQIMAIPDRTERLKAIALNKHLF